MKIKMSFEPKLIKNNIVASYQRMIIDTASAKN